MIPSPPYQLHRAELLPLLRKGDAALARAMSESKLVAAGDYIINAEQPCDLVYRVETGWLCRTRTLPDGRRQIIALFLPGDLCGAKSLFLAVQPDSIQAITATTVRMIEQSRLAKLVENDYGIALRVMWQIAEDERRLHNAVIGLGRGNATERMTAMMIELRERLLCLGLAREDAFHLPLTQQQIADYLGLTVVHVNRVLRRLREEAIATVRKNGVFVEDWPRLASIAHPILDVFERQFAFAADAPAPRPEPPPGSVRGRPPVT